MLHKHMSFALQISNALGYRQATSREKASRRLAKCPAHIEKSDINADKSKAYGILAQQISKYIVPIFQRVASHKTSNVEGTAEPRPFICKTSIHSLWLNFMHELSGSSFVNSGNPDVVKSIAGGINFAFYNIGTTLTAIVRHLNNTQKLTRKNFRAYLNSGKRFVQEIAKLPNGPLLHAFTNYFLDNCRLPFTTDLRKVRVNPSDKFLQEEQLDESRLEFNDSKHSMDLKASSVTDFIDEYKKSLKADRDFRQRDNISQLKPNHGCPAKFVSVELAGQTMNLIDAFYTLCSQKVEEDLFGATQN